MKLEDTKRNKNLKRDPVSKTFYWRQFANGKRFFRSTGENKSEAKAERIGQRLFAEWLGTPEARNGVQYLFEHIAMEVLEIKSIKSKKTLISAKAHILKHLMPFFKGYPIESLNETLWEQYIVEEHHKNSTRKLFNDRKHLIMIAKRAYQKGLLQRPLQFRNPDPKESPGRSYTEEEIGRLLLNAGKDLRLQIMLGFMNGMRRSEILKLSWTRINVEAGYIRLRAEDTKIRKERTIPIHPEIIPVLRERLCGATSTFVFPSPKSNDRPIEDNKTAWFGCKKKAAVKGRFHDLVHTFMTWGIYKYKIPLSVLCAISGKSVVVAERIYIHNEPQSLKGALEGFKTKLVSGGNWHTKTEDENINDNLQ